MGTGSLPTDLNAAVTVNNVPSATTFTVLNNSAGGTYASGGTYARTITGVSVNAGVSYTITCSATHSLFASDTITISGITGTGSLPGDLNATVVVDSVPSSKTFTVLNGSAGGTYTAGGTFSRTAKLYVRTHDLADPGTGRLIGGYKSAILFNSCDYVYADLAVECTGTSDNTDVPDGAAVNVNLAVRISACNDFWLTGTINDGRVNVDSGSTNVTADNLTIRVKGRWEFFSATDALAVGGNDPWDETKDYDLWEHNNLYNAILYRDIGTGGVIRNSTLHGGGVLVNGSATQSKFMDIYNTTLTRIGEDSIEADTHAAIGLAVFQCAFSQGTTNVISISPVASGPQQNTESLGRGLAPKRSSECWTLIAACGRNDGRRVVPSHDARGKVGAFKMSYVASTFAGWNLASRMPSVFQPSQF
jgi:hypothetical protein